MSTDPTQNVTNGAIGNPLSTESRVLETGAALVQDFSPVKQICAHLNAFHVYATDPGRCVEANHYCTHLNEGTVPFFPITFLSTWRILPDNPTSTDVRQCLIYDTPLPNARLIGVEYMISAAVYKTLDPSERRLWHSHVFEVKSGMLIMPGPNGLPTGIWEEAETKEMEQVVGLYGKTYHFWQVDRGDKLPLGEAQLMMSFTDYEQFPQFSEVVGDRDRRYGVSCEQKREKRRGIVEPEIHADADSVWKEGSKSGEKKQSGQGVDAGHANYPEGVQNSIGRTAEGPN